MRALLLTTVFLLFGAIVSMSPPVKAAGSTSIVIIVNAENAVTSDDYGIDDFRKIFLKQSTEWPDNTEITAFQLASGTDEAELFRKEILDKDSKELAKYWSTKKADEGVSEPKSKKTSAEVFKLVSKKVAAIGYISESYFNSLTEEKKKMIKVLRTI